MRFMKVRKVWSIISIAILAAVLMAVSVAPGEVAASRSGCRADPLITLFDGTQIQIVTGIGTSISDIQSIVYTVHAPAGSGVATVIYTYSILGVRETLQFYADAPAGQYTTDTIVYTGTRGVAVDTTTNIIKLLGLESKSARGLDRQHLVLRLTP